MPDSFPPANFIPTPSAVSGIELYMPAPPEEDQREVVEFKCPQCGAGTAYSAADGGLTCTHCGYYEPPQRAIVGKGAEELEFTLEAVRQAARGWGEARRELQCQGCGAYTSLSPDALTYTCPFCGSNKVIQRQARQDLLRPRFLIPFTLKPNECQALTRQWLGRSWFAPRRLRQLGLSSGFNGVYVPFWTFDAEATADWQAEVGQVKGSGKNQHTVWKQQKGQVSRYFDDFLMAGTGRLSPRLLEQVKNYELGRLAPYEPTYLAGFQAQAYDIPLETAWTSARQTIREQIRRTCYDQASLSCQGSQNCQVRDLSLTLDFKDERWRYILLPVYLAAFTDRQQTYQVIINAQTRCQSLSRQRPVCPPNH